VRGVEVAVERALLERQSQCLSSVHVGRDDYRLMVIADPATGSRLSMINPAIFQVGWAPLRGLRPPPGGAKRRRKLSSGGVLMSEPFISPTSPQAIWTHP
jgi:hypothetical protein